MTAAALPEKLEHPTTSRVSFRQPVTGSGFVDAGWWPRSDDLVTEVPALLEVFWTAGRDITRVSYNLDHWRTAPRQMIIEGHRVHLGGYHRQNPLLLSVSDARHNDTIDLLIVPPDTDPERAERLLTLASTTGDDYRPERMFELADAALHADETLPNRCAP
jgi:hypothetical protein